MTMPIQGGSAASGTGVQQLLQALGAGNKAAADELIREFNQTFGLNQQQFQASVQQYNKTFGLTQQVDQANIAAQAAGLTGFFNGQQTLAGQAQAQSAALQQAQLSGQYNGAPTEAAREFNTAQAEQQRQFNLNTGLQGLQLASTLQANPFRQAQALYGLGQGGYSPLMGAAAGTGPAVTAFQAPTLSAADTATLPWLASQTGGNSYTADQSTQWMNALPGPQAVNWTAVNQAGPGATNLVQQGLAQKWGLDPATIAAIQQQAMPGFQAPTLSGAFKG